ncbi:MAG TPA: DUF4382 domain-containing protein [Bacteroidales bacterium]|nr:DUF4382 domain-containing protein [Bacteroidales bacterium]
MKRKALWLMILAVTLIAVSCKKDNNNSSENKPSYLTIRLTDAPAVYDAVNIDIQSVGVHVDSGWYNFTLQNPGVFDLISLSNGTTALLVSNISVPAGTINQMRLHLGNNNTIVVDGVTHDLTTPSGQTSGYKVKMNATIQPGASYVVLIDFDAEKSIVKQGNGTYLLKPIVYGNLVANIGQIDGTVVPLTGGNFASAWNATDTLSVFINQVSGYFLINSLVPGNYTVKITASSPYKDTTLLNIPVSLGQVTHLDSIHLAQ